MHRRPAHFLKALTRFGLMVVAVASVVVVWIVLDGEDFPRFVTAYPGANR